VTGHLLCRFGLQTLWSKQGSCIYIHLRHIQKAGLLFFFWSHEIDRDACPFHRNVHAHSAKVKETMPIAKPLVCAWQHHGVAFPPSSCLLRICNTCYGASPLTSTLPHILYNTLTNFILSFLPYIWSCLWTNRTKVILQLITFSYHKSKFI
jgi:hypothetical protein